LSSTVDKKTDGRRGKGEHAHNATEYDDQPNGPVTVMLDNLNG
jgi:hypothetical protein